MESLAISPLHDVPSIGNKHTASNMTKGKPNHASLSIVKNFNPSIPVIQGNGNDCTRCPQAPKLPSNVL